MEEKKFYGMQNDYMFKAVLQKSEVVLRNLLATLLDIDETTIKSCVIENTIELGKSIDSKDCILDVKITLNSSEIINIELQMHNEGNWPERSLLYWSRAYDKLKVGENYSLLKRTYHIGILNYTLFKDNPSFYSEYKIMDTQSHFIYSDKLAIRILDLSLSDSAANINPQLIKWAKVFKVQSMNELEKLTGSEEVFNTMVLTLRELSEDERIRLQCQAREDYERRLSGQYDRGLIEGKKIGLERGEQLGLEKGEKYGFEKGIQLISDILSGQDDGDLLNKGYSKENIDLAKTLIASNIQ